MKRSEKDAPSELVAAAIDLDAELRRFGHLAESLRQGELSSQKKIQRIAKLFQELPEAEARLTALVQQLIGTLTRAREAQQAQVEAVQERAYEFEARTGVLQKLLGDYGKLGQSAASLNAMVQEVAAMPMGDDTASLSKAAKVGDVMSFMDGLMMEAQQLVQDCSAKGFLDVGRMADSLRQQLQDARKKMQHLHRSLGGSEPTLH